ncbi:vps33p [Saccharomyces arboricola H-6]|uniref:Vps33p n=1 Tax=Saccharomyces arboricola (strain H-6 / AS 2.3317 / CBS 10644) TaxID=1160507 RepID=J8LKR0_SACAR|nr:vps33p [Saccharomyces arboricola H-6]
MNKFWNTRKFSLANAAGLCATLNEISQNDEVLVVQPSFLPILNSLLTFLELTESTPVRKIALLNDQLSDDLSLARGSVPQMDLVFLVDVRTSLQLPSELLDAAKKHNLSPLHIIYCRWKTSFPKHSMDSEQGQKDGYTLDITEPRFPNIIESQLSEISNEYFLYPLDLLPFPQIDDNVLLSHSLYNMEDVNMYYPELRPLQNATESILVDNMVNCLRGLIFETNSIITNVVSIGNLSKRCSHLLKKRIDEQQTDNDTFIKGTLYGERTNCGLEMDLIILERNIDPITPLLTQLTYAGLLDDLYEFNSGLKIKEKDTNFNYKEDTIWNDLKFLNFGSVGPQLNKLAKELQTQYDMRHKAESVHEIKEFVDSLGSLQQRQAFLKNHTTLSSDVLKVVETEEYGSFNKIIELELEIMMGNTLNKDIEDIILELQYEYEADKKKILRLICLLSLCKNSLREKDYEDLRTFIIDSWGIDKCFQLESLTELGFFTSKTGKSDLHTISTRPTRLQKEYRYISEWLNTVPIEEEHAAGKSTNEQEEFVEATFAYSGVVPLTTRLVQMLYDRSILFHNYSSQQPFILSREPRVSQTEDLIEQLYGDSHIIEESRWVPETITKKINASIKRNNRQSVDGSKGACHAAEDIALVVFLGGVTIGEIATLKHLQKKLSKKGINKRFIIIADGLTNGDRIMNSIS